jgi:Glycosyl transferase family 11
MIIIKLFGGLGNQMFQYALGRQLSIKYNKRLYLETSWFKRIGNNNNRPYRLDHFMISGKKINSIILSIIFKLLPYYNIKEKECFKFNSNILNKSSGYFTGFWQNENYFSDIRTVLLKDFSLNYKYSDSIANIKKEISNQNSVSVHIRRGDFLQSKDNNNKHGVCSPDYILQAMKLIEGKVPNPTYYVFSDEIDWVKNNIIFKNKAILVSDKGFSEVEELILMSNCKHDIIANSSFSWWGAWLNDNINKIVIAPVKWGEIDNPNFKDLIPKTWTRI